MLLSHLPFSHVLFSLSSLFPFFVQLLLLFVIETLSTNNSVAYFPLKCKSTHTTTSSNSFYFIVHLDRLSYNLRCTNEATKKIIEILATNDLQLRKTIEYLCDLKWNDFKHFHFGFGRERSMCSFGCVLLRLQSEQWTNVTGKESTEIAMENRMKWKIKIPFSSAQTIRLAKSWWKGMICVDVCVCMLFILF